MPAATTAFSMLTSIDNFRRERIRGDPVNQREFKSELDVEKIFMSARRFLSLQVRSAPVDGADSFRYAIENRKEATK